MTEFLTNAIGAVLYFLITVGGLIQPEEIEDIAVFLCSERAKMITS